MEKAVVPGLSIALIRDGRLFWSHGFGVGNATSKQPVTTNTVFEAASLSKPVFAYMALKLCEDGVLDLDTPLIEYLPEEQRSQERLFNRVVNEPRLRCITTRHVLSHTPGFPNWAPDGEPLRIYLTPGERFSYSGEGYVFLQRVIECITGRACEEYLRARLLEPFDMHSSCFIWTQNSGLPTAQGHDEQGQPVEKREWPQMNAAASLHCTPTDYARFMCALIRPPCNVPHSLSPAMIQEMLRPQIQVNNVAPWHQDWPSSDFKLNSAVSWGLGWGIQHKGASDAFWHWGDNGPFKAFAVGYKNEGVGAVVMANSVNAPTIWKDVLLAAIGGAYPGIDWLEDLA